MTSILATKVASPVFEQIPEPVPAPIVLPIDSYRLTALLTQSFEEQDVPTIILLDDLSIVGINARGRQMIEQNSEFRLTEGKFLFRKSLKSDYFRTLLEKMNNETVLCKILQLEVGEPLVFRIQRILPSGLPRSAFKITWISPRVAQERYWADLTTILNLTRAEERIAKQLFEGLDLRELAETSGITIETVRTHIRRIYQKTGVVSREKLQVVLAPYQMA